MNTYALRGHPCAIALAVLVALVAPLLLPVSSVTQAAQKPAARCTKTSGQRSCKKRVISLKPNPLNVAPDLDASHASTATVTSEGGTVSTTDAHGTVYTLNVPKGALFTSTDITMTPISGLQGLKFSGGLAGGIQLQPEGLSFLAPATLTIVLHSAIPPQRQLAISADGSGKGLHAYPQGSDRSQITLELYHFSLYGVGNGTAQDLVSLVKHMPGQYRGQLEQLRAAYAQEALYQRYGVGQPYRPGELRSLLANTLLTAWEESIQPALQQATTDDSIAQAAVSAELGWERDIQLVGFTELDSQVLEAHQLIEKIMQNAWDKTSQHCADEHDLGQIQRMVGIMRSFLLWNESKAPSQAELDAKIRNCVRFTLDMTATVEVQNQNIGVKVSGKVDAKGVALNLASSWETGGLTGQTPIQYSNATIDVGVQGSRCTISFAGVQQKEPLRVDPLLITEFGKKDKEGKVVPPKLQMTMTPGWANEQFVSHCPGESDTVYGSYAYYTAAWNFTQKALETGPKRYPMHYLIADWNYLGGEVYATKTLDGTHTESGMKYTLHVELTLHHTAIK